MLSFNGHKKLALLKFLPGDFAVVDGLHALLTPFPVAPRQGSLCP